MAQRFKVVNIQKNNEPGGYTAEVEFEGTTEKYEIISNASIYYLDWIDKLSILDGFDCPFNGEKPYIQIKGQTAEAKEKESGLEKAFYEFIETECSDNGNC